MTWLRQLPTEEAAPGQLMALAGNWDFHRGDHPTFASHLAHDLANAAQLPRFPSGQQWAQLSPLQLPLQLVTHGHHVWRDAGPRHTLNADELDEYPLAPVFVRDLAGRVIHTGLTPLPTPPDLPLFPAGCADVATTIPGAEQIENVLFLTLRRLELGAGQGGTLAGQPEWHRQALYPQPTQVPYKIRPDTFYQDGWRLPQVPRLFVRTGDTQAATALGQKFIAEWETWCARASIEPDYEAFYEHHGGASWFDELFLQGCTIIPTVESYNGHYTVAEDFSVRDVGAGHAVPGLHTVVEEVESPHPAGTILAVRRPGYAVAQTVVPAQVVVSNGALANASTAPAPQLPNMALPHPRLALAKWGDVWLPTHPQHFQAPALWNWQSNGHFCQVSGPVWDPLHYVYASTPVLVRASTRPHPDYPHVFPLPEAFRSRFHPVVPLTWVDVVNELTATARPDTHTWHGSVLDTVRLAQTVAPIGYHPLPAMYEPELAPDAFPQLAPQHQQVVLGACPAILASRLAPLAAVVNDVKLPSPTLLTQPLRAAWQQAEALAKVNAPFQLPELPVSHLQLNVKRLFANRHYRRALALVSPTLGAGLFHLREAGLAWRRKRYRLSVRYPAAWAQAWVKALGFVEIEAMLGDINEKSHAEALAQRLAQHPMLVPPVRQVATSLPVAAPVKRRQSLSGAAATAKLSKSKALPRA